MYFKTKELVTMALFGAMIFTLVFVLGAVVLSVTGIPMSAGITNVFITVVVITIGAKIINKFGVATVMTAIAGTLSIPTISFGTPGIYKIITLGLVGLIIDLAISLLKRSNKGFILGGLLGSGLTVPITFAAMILLGLPGVDKMKPFILMFSLIYAVLGAMGAWFGAWLFEKKLKNKAFVKNLQG
ncbi:MAG: hypothetical protein WCX69_02830 [Candidatus Paceibacterota bacterium]